MTWLTSPAANEHPGQRLKQLLKKEEILRVPGAHNGLTALIAKEAGFDCLYLLHTFVIVCFCMCLYVLLFLVVFGCIFVDVKVHGKTVYEQ